MVAWNGQHQPDKKVCHFITYTSNNIRTMSYFRD